MNKELILGFFAGSGMILLVSFFLEPSTPVTPVNQQTITVDDKKVLSQLVEVRDEIRELKKGVSSLNLNIDALSAKIGMQVHTGVNQVERTIARPVQSYSERVVSSTKGKAPGSLDWLDNLPADKQAEVDQVFADIGRDFPIEDIDQEDFETLNQMMIDQQNALKKKMKIVLTEKDYQSFEKSLPTF